ncbi:hypothetical protein PPERSA_08129 [Pseudocohnilembus persalinus]|uniref:Protein kinase-like domain n=1 Tax=Pseudocohnilembus persalinus TaxID=266149 RepID=A0A0V0QLC0_PSEPJ|nr:hypothetical protein PPERSA_08129 [Pseudocohnilembus persalinus]|eukprot:KRX03054.1 hypothetical protein PPERSA_08129 [Pseudocohnilembus persalinus]
MQKTLTIIFILLLSTNQQQEEKDNTNEENSEKQDTDTTGQQLLFYLQIAGYVIAGAIILCAVMNIITKIKKNRKEKKLKEQKLQEKSSRQINSSRRSQGIISTQSYNKQGTFPRVNTSQGLYRDSLDLNSLNGDFKRSNNHHLTLNISVSSKQQTEKKNQQVEKNCMPKHLSANIQINPSKDIYLVNFKSSQEFLQAYDINGINPDNLINKEDALEENKIKDQLKPFDSPTLLNNLKKNGNNTFILENKLTNVKDELKVIITKNKNKFHFAKCQIEKEYMQSQISEYCLQYINDLYFWFCEEVYIIVISKKYDEEIQGYQTVSQWINKSKNLSKTFSISSANHKVDMMTDLYFSKSLFLDQLQEEDLKYFSPKMQQLLQSENFQKKQIQDIMNFYTPPDLVYTLGVLYLEIHEERIFNTHELAETLEQMEMLENENSVLQENPLIQLIFQMINLNEEIRIRSLQEVSQNLSII